MVVNQSRDSSASRHDPLRNERTGNVKTSDRIAIQNLLNPMDNDRNRMDSRSPPSESASESTLFTPVSSPQSTGSSDTDVTAWSAASPVRENVFRRPYTQEQVMWIWFFFIDAGMKWDEVVERFEADWPGEERTKTGMQCKAYRLCGQFGLPRKRLQKEGPQNPAFYGMWPNTRRSYRWMDEFAHNLPGQSVLEHDDALLEIDLSIGYVPGGPYYPHTN